MNWSSINELFVPRRLRPRGAQRNWAVAATPLLCGLGFLQTSSQEVLAQSKQIDQSDVAAAEQVQQVWDLQLTPASEPRPALKYQLRPPYRMQQPGDATPHYYRALLMDAELPSDLKKQYVDRSEHWSGDDDASREEMRKWLAKYHQVYKELLIATYRERVDWDLRIRDLKGMETIAFLLPDAQRMRDLGRMLQIKARLEISEGHFDEAIETLRVGYRLSYAVAQTPTLINDLVGVAITSMMTVELTRLVAQPDAPNMYWAIASLPHPVIDMREAMDWERSVPWKIFPLLRDPENAVRTSDEWRQFVTESYTKFHELSGDYAGKPGPMSELMATGLVMKNYPLAKQALIEGGMDRERVDAMPVGQVIAIHTSRSLEYAYDETFKWMLLASGDIYERGAATERRLREEGHFGEGGRPLGILPIGGLLIPAVSQAWFAAARLERQLAAVQTIEAIRLYAASHDGELPKSLDEIESVVVPSNSVYLKQLEYRVDGKQAVLETVPRSKDRRRSDVYRYQLRVN
ncbi:MAG: hypothetical protein H8E66_11635 [Planctomycetes bacterium]|nr:hypothetical protein [Planctomycetota bacterium]